MPTSAEPRTSSTPDIADVLKAIASADGSTWFPAEYAAEMGVPRAELNPPLNELRVAGYIEVVDWARGRGQGYGLTAEGRRALNLSGPIEVNAPKLRATEANPAKLTPFERGEQALNSFFTPRPALVTPILVVVIVLWFLAGLGLAIHDGSGASAYLRGASPAILMKLGAVSGSNLLLGQWWRLGTCTFVHIGLIHIAVNLYALISIGPVAEGLWGRWRFLFVFFGGGLAGAGLAMAIRPESALAGASGAVWGVLASVVAWLALFASHFPPDLVTDLARRLGIALGINALISFAPGVSWEAHLGGGVAGFCVALLTHLLRPGYGWKSLAAAAVLVFLPIVCVAGLKRTIDRSQAWAPLRYREELRQQLERSPAYTVSAQVPIPIYPRVSALYADATVANMQGSPENLAKVRTQVELLKAEAVAARAALDVLVVPEDKIALRDKSKTYLDALILFMASLEEMTAPDRKPDPAKAVAWGKQKKAVEAAWKAVAGQ